MEFSDISDDDCFEIPCSQKDIKTMATEERSVQHASVKRLNFYDFFKKVDVIILCMFELL